MKLFLSTLLVHEEKEVDTNTNPGVLGWSSSFFPASVPVGPPFLVGLLDGLIFCPLSDRLLCLMAFISAHAHLSPSGQLESSGTRLEAFIGVQVGAAIFRGWNTSGQLESSGTRPATIGVQMRVMILSFSP